MAGVKFPSSFDVTGRFPLDAKYWVASIANLSDGEIYAGLHRWTIDTGKEYVYQNSNTWKDVSNGDRGDAGTITIGNVTNGLLAKVINRGTISDAILDITLPKGDAGSTPIIDIGTVSSGNTPAVINVGTPDRAILNFVIPASAPGTNGLDGKSVWFAYAESATGTNPAYTAINKSYISIVAAYQQPALPAFTNWIQLKGIDGVNGKSTYIAYSAFSNGSGASFILSTVHKYISILTGFTQPLLTDFTTWVLFKGLDGGPAGASAYQTWLTLGNSGTEAQFIASLAGANGKSAYDVWISLGNTGTPQQFIDSFKFTLLPSSITTLGGVKVGANLTIAADGTLNAPAPGTNYALPQSSPSILGGLKLGNGLALNTTSGLVDASAPSILWQINGGPTSPGYKAGQLLHNSAGVDFYYLADITAANVTAEPLLTTSADATNALVHPVGTWQYVGTPSKANISMGPLDSTVTLATTAQYNIFYYSVFKTGLIDSYMCSYGTYFGGPGTAVGTGHMYNTYGGDCSGLVLGARHLSNRFGNGVTNITIGDDLTYSIIGDNCGFLTIGAGCTRIELYNCIGGGTLATQFSIPAGTHDAVYRNNALVLTPVRATSTNLGLVKGGGNVTINADGSMTAPTSGTNYTLPQSTADILGGIKLGTNLSLNATTGRVDSAGSTGGVTQSYVDTADGNLQTQITSNTNSITTKANIASPTFTGTPTLPTGTIATTQASGTNTTTIATTAFVTAADTIIQTQVTSNTSTTSSNSSRILLLEQNPLPAVVARDIYGVVIYQGTNLTAAFTAVNSQVYPSNPGANGLFGDIVLALKAEITANVILSAGTTLHGNDYGIEMSGFKLSYREGGRINGFNCQNGIMECTANGGFGAKTVVSGGFGLRMQHRALVGITAILENRQLTPPVTGFMFGGGGTFILTGTTTQARSEDIEPGTTVIGTTITRPTYTNPVNNETTRIFSATEPLYLDPDQSEFSINYNSSTPTFTRTALANRVGTTMTFGVTGNAIAIGQLAIRIRAFNGIPAGPALTNPIAFAAQTAAVSLLQPTPNAVWVHYTQAGGAANYFTEDTITTRIEIVTPTAASNSIQFGNHQGILVNGKAYNIKIKAKASAACNLSVQNFLAVSPYTDFGGGSNLALTTVYQDFVLPFTSTSMTGTTDDSICTFQVGGFPGFIFWFQVQVVAV